MKRNVLIISNSHGSALIQSIRQRLATSEHQLQFLIQGANTLLPNLVYKEKKLWPQSEGARLAIERVRPQKAFIDLTSYSHIVVYGCQLVCMGSGVDWIFKLKQSTQPFSIAARTASYTDSIVASAHYAFLERITDSDIRSRVLSVPAPFPNETHPSLKTAKNIEWDHPRRFLTMVSESITALGIRYMPIPKHMLTPNQSAIKKMYKSERENDFSHLNPAGGAELLNSILAELDEF